MGQGKVSVLSNSLFFFYINEVFGKINNLPCGCLLDGNRVNVLCYAEHFVLLAPSAKGLQKMLATIQVSLTKI